MIPQRAHPPVILFSRVDAKPADEEAKLAGDAEPEVQIYLQLLVTAFLIDGKRNAEAAECSEVVVEQVSRTRRRISNELAAKAFFFYSWANELVGKSAAIR
jgi:26S proteasome regulatory subunit N3